MTSHVAFQFWPIGTFVHPSLGRKMAVLTWSSPLISGMANGQPPPPSSCWVGVLRGERMLWFALCTNGEVYQ